MTDIHPPRPQDDWAWFFDIDGTLAAIAVSPDMVEIDPVMRLLIQDLYQRSNGAVALISGRAVRDIDKLFPGLHLAVAGQHGAERRNASGVLLQRVKETPGLAAMRNRLREIENHHHGLLLEDKGLSLALHYRQAPELGAFVHDQVAELMMRYGEGMQMQEGKCVVEVVPISTNKGDALREFMAEPPFRGRVPVFLGDDVTDENAFNMVNELGGLSIKVGAGPTHARACLKDVGAVRDWLATTAAKPMTLDSSVQEASHEHA